MNIQEYISSGILEAYALGELTEQEKAVVEKNLALYPELRKEMADIERIQEKMLMDAAIQPRASVKQNIFEKIEQSAPETKVIPLTSTAPGVGIWKFAAAASITVALLASYLAFNYWNKWKTSEQDLRTLIAQNQQMAQDYNQVNQRLDQIEKDLMIKDNPAFRRVVMKGTPNAPEAVASVYWNESTQEVYLSIQQMKSLARENQYQLWAIIDGKPVDAGVFDADIANRLIKMKNIGSGAATFAVTIEPRGGKESPSLETMQVAGNVVKG